MDGGELEEVHPVFRLLAHEEDGLALDGREGGRGGFFDFGGGGFYGSGEGCGFGRSGGFVCGGLMEIGEDVLPSCGFTGGVPT